jgi:hypothetical protein
MKIEEENKKENEKSKKHIGFYRIFLYGDIFYIV